MRLGAVYARLRRHLLSYLDSIVWRPVGGAAEAIYQRVSAYLDAESDQEVRYG